MLKVKVRFTGKKVDIDKVVSFMTEFMDDDYTYKVLTLSDVSSFYPNRGSSEEGRVYCDFNYDPDIYHYEDDFNETESMNSLASDYHCSFEVDKDVSKVQL